MRRIPLLLVALLALLVATPALVPSRPAAADGGQVAGMVLSSRGQTQSTAEAVSRMKADGINTVSLFVWWWTDNPQSTTLAPYGQTEPDAQLSAQIATVRQAGLKVILVPIFYCGSCEGGWRGVMQPSDDNAFFASYQQFIDHYARLAQADGVWLLFAGSEMTTLEGMTPQWQSVISSVRQNYSGLVGYEQNWDVLAHPQFLSDVDVVGVSAYFPLDDGAQPTVSQLVADWSNSHAAADAGRNWVGDLTHLANTTGKPILFGEVGYMDSTYAGRQPFLNSFTAADSQLQADLYQALLQTFSGYSWWMGVSWWEWSDNPADSNRTPMGQPAEQLLQKWYAQGWRPSNADPTGAPATGTSAGSPTVGSPTTLGSASGGHGTTTTTGAGLPGGAVSSPALAGATGRLPSEAAPSAPAVPGRGTRPGGAAPGVLAAGPALSADGSTPGGAGVPGQAVLATSGISGRGPGFYTAAAVAALALALAAAQLLADLTRRPALAEARARRRSAVTEHLRSIPQR
ncbi:MAG TPA: hypothetical protein VFW24_16335 [Acidimicrobiales bacterium]|nr:hypothetical protein [Acidimicrobiales bacterium]